jgi:hypothetical protein
MKLRALAVLIAAICALTVARTGSASAAVRPSPPPDGFVTTTVKTAGISVALPVTWLALDPKSPRSTTALQQVADKNPALKSTFAQWSTLRSSVKLWAIDAAATEFASNLIVLPTPVDKSIVNQPANVEAALKSSLGSAASSLIAHKVKLAGVAAVEADAVLNVNAADGTPFTAYATIYFLPTKKGVIDVDYTSATAPSDDTTLQTIVHNLRSL